MGTGYYGGFGNSYGAKEQMNIPISSLGDVRCIFRMKRPPFTEF